MNTKLNDTHIAWLNRRQWLSASIATATIFMGSRATMAFAPAPLAAGNESGLFRVRVVLEVNGEIRLKSQTSDGTGKNGKTIAAKTAPLKATSTIDFDEHFETTTDLIGCKAYQYFHEAGSEIQIDRHVTKTTLREQCKDILRLGCEQGFMTTCPDNPLFAAERDLIEGPINTMFLDQLLTENEVHISDKWSIDNEVICRLLNMDKVHDGKWTMCLVDASDEKAQLQFEGVISASVRQVPTSIKVEGKAELDRQGGYISWFAANIEETREIGDAEPGFKIIAQVKILRSKIDEMTTGLSLQKIAAKVSNRDLASMLQFQSDLGYYRFIASNKWSTYRDNGEESTLRYVVGNRIAAQCNITNMINYEPGRQLSLDGFKADVKNALGNALSEIVEGAERLSSNKLRILRVMSRGGVQGVDIQWIHYHISNDNGRRVVLTFTLNEANVELFAAEDAQIADSFELIDWPTKLDEKAIDAADKAADNSTNSTNGATKPIISQPGKKGAETPAVSSRPKIAR